MTDNEKLIDAAESMTADEIHQHPMAAVDKLRALARELRAAEKAHTPTRTVIQITPEAVQREYDLRNGATPTNDEREALAFVIEQGWGNPTWDGKTLRPIDRQIADAVLDAGFRRSEVPEPTAHRCEECQTCGVHGASHLKCCGCYDGVCCQEPQGEPSSEVPEPSAKTVHRGTFGHVWPCPLFYVGNWRRGDEEHYPKKECTNSAVCEAVQGEPSDAQVQGLITRAQSIVDSMKSSTGRRTRGDEWCYVRYGQVESLGVVLAALRAAGGVR